MKVSICITVFNEENNISKLIESLLNQEKRPDEIVIVDGGSTDKTVNVIRHYQKKDRRIKLLVNRCSRAEGRNLSIEMAKNDIIAMTDAGCIAKKKWLKNITEPFKNDQINVVAGFYDMVTKNPMQKAMSFFLGLMPDDFDVNFLPSTRSIAFRKNVWEKIGGFPKNLEDTAEDTVFNYRLVKEGIKFAWVKNAKVEWSMPDTLREFSQKIFLYAKGDVNSGIWIHPSKGIMSHNLKAIYKIIRYLLGLVLFIIGFITPVVWAFLTFVIIIYSYWAFRKVYKEFTNITSAIWGVFLQYITDISVVSGFVIGIFRKITLKYEK